MLHEVVMGSLKLRVAAAGEPASEDEIGGMLKLWPALPLGYLELLREANGFSGEFGDTSDYVDFASITDALDANQQLGVPDKERGFFWVGGNGGIDGFFVSTTGDGSWMVLPLLDIGIGSVRLESKFPSIKEFADFIANRFPENAE